MSSAVGSINNVKIFVLYLMENVGVPLDFVTLNDIIMQTDYVMYLDFAEAFHKMLDDGLIAEHKGEGEADYTITEKGKLVAESLRSDILPGILDKSLAAALRYLDFQKRGVRVKCCYEKVAEGNYRFTCSLNEGEKVLFSTELAVDSEDRAKRLCDNFRDRPDVVYRGAFALLSGNMNFLLN